MFNAGLGGSAAYGNALGDLYSNTATQAVLNGQSMANAATQTNQNSLNAVNSAYGQNQNYALNLQQLANTYNTNANQQALQQWQTSVPYLSSVNNNQGAGYGQLIGAVGGGIAGAFAGNPIAGATIGSSLGGGVDSAMGNTSVGGSAISSSLNGLYALQGAGFGVSSPLMNAGNSNNGFTGNYNTSLQASPYAPNNMSVFQ